MSVRGGKPGAKADRDLLRERLLREGCTVDQVADEFRARWRFTPLAAYRYAAGMTQAAAAAAYNRITGDVSASMDASLLSKLEQWPSTGKAPTVYNLAVLAKVYGTAADRLVSAVDLPLLPSRDRLALTVCQPGANTVSQSSRTGVAVAVPETVTSASHSPRSAQTGSTFGGCSDADWHQPANVHQVPRQPVNNPVEYRKVSLNSTVLAAIEQQRYEMDLVLSRGTVTDSWMALIEETAAEHSREYIWRAPLPMLGAVVAEFSRVRSLLGERQTTRIQQRLCAVAAQLSILAADALMKLGRVNDARAWYRTARLAADEADRRELGALARAQPAMLPYYYGDVAEAVRLAVEAQEMTAGTASWASAFGAAAEARAAARLGDAERALEAMTNAERSFEAAVEPSAPEDAFQFPHRRLLFYLSGALSYLNEPERAESVQTEALQEYAADPGRFVIDPVLIKLDQAGTLVQSGYADDACELALDAVTRLPEEHRTDIVIRRSREIVRSVRVRDQHRSTVRNLTQILDAAMV